MAVTLRQDEAVPAAYPTVSGLSDAADALDKDALWQRIESHCAHRWTSREVIWTIDGTGDWKAPLAPAVVDTVEVWQGGAWTSLTAEPSPWGLWFSHDGPWRVTATVGASVNCPAAVLEAFRRLAEYSAEIGSDGMMGGHTSHASHSVNIGGDLSEDFSRAQNWAARALQLSGAADLLRPYRRA
jgi:hypothetical protein